MINNLLLQEMADAIRFLTIKAVEKAKSGHPGMPLGMADVATVLFSKFLNFNPQEPGWKNRDRFILSAGHGSMLLYSLLYMLGYKDFSLETIKQFRQLHSNAAGHPEYKPDSGIETTTGPLGQGIANAVGMAIAANISAAKLPEGVIDNYTYVIAGDGCLMEGISHEAASLAGHLKLGNLIVFFDNNNISIDGNTDLTVSDDQTKRFQAYNWHTIEIDGHDFIEIEEAIKQAQSDKRPTLISCKTKIAIGLSGHENSSSGHSWPLEKESIDSFYKKCGYENSNFEIKANILLAWKQVADNAINGYNTWKDKIKLLGYDEHLSVFNEPDLNKIFLDIKEHLSKNVANEATRKSSGYVIATLSEHLPQLIGGSADLTGSNSTKSQTMRPINASDFSGSYIYYGVRENAMAGIMNGLTLYDRRIIPYGGTFLVFSDYCRPSIRLSALIGLRVIYIMTHDSIGVGEDGPTHQPVEQLSSLRAMPNLNVFRPADALETAECWQIALQNNNTPSLLALTRQGVPRIRDNHINDNLCKYGAYIIQEASNNNEIKITIFATGSELSIALEASKKLESQGFSTRVVSVPCFELFELQDANYVQNLLCNNSLKIAVEASICNGWERFIGAHGIFVGMKSFGQSAPAEDLYEYFSITAEAIVSRALQSLT